MSTLTDYIKFDEPSLWSMFDDGALEDMES